MDEIDSSQDLKEIKSRLDGPKGAEYEPDQVTKDLVEAFEKSLLDPEPEPEPNLVEIALGHSKKLIGIFNCLYPIGENTEIRYSKNHQIPFGESVGEVVISYQMSTRERTDCRGLLLEFAQGSDRAIYAYRENSGYDIEIWRRGDAITPYEDIDDERREKIFDRSINILEYLINEYSSLT